MKHRLRTEHARPLLLTVGLLLSGCMVGPDYHRPAAQAPAGYKELPGWKPADPRDGLNRGAWWTVFDDPLLSSLEQQVAITNQNVRAAEAAYQQAVALTDEARAGLYPTLGIAAGVTRSSAGAGGISSSGFSVSSTRTQYSVEGTPSWDIDVWGRIRRQVEAQAAAAQVSQADLANAALSAQATLAIDYFSLHAQDSLEILLRNTVAAYQRTLDITRNQYNAGTVSRADVVVADAQVRSTQSQLEAVGVSRATFEHAIAVLTGHPPSDLSIPRATLTTTIPVVPAGIPSELLERRPDIAAAERGVAEQNANIGVAVAAYYPDISLSAAFGFAGDPISKLFTVASRVWSLGASASETIFQGGERSAAVRAARASYDESVATYRQTVLSAFQQVEDELSTLRILQRQAMAADEAVRATQHAVDVTLNEYRAGTVAFTTVVTEEAALLADQQSALAVQESRVLAAITLIEALGGGWQSTGLTAVPAVNPLLP